MPDSVAAALAPKSCQVGVELPPFFYDIELPARAIPEGHTDENWRWRMAAREMMEREDAPTRRQPKPSSKSACATAGGPAIPP
ncbi:MAG TPA: hypothetical protein VIL46_04075 [Gemmataceae bacterium]